MIAAVAIDVQDDTTFWGHLTIRPAVARLAHTHAVPAGALHQHRPKAPVQRCWQNLQPTCSDKCVHGTPDATLGHNVGLLNCR